MNFQELKTKLTVTNGTLSIAKGDLTPNFDTMLDQCYFKEGQQLLINLITTNTVDERLSQITIQGKSAYLSLPSVVVKAVFRIDTAANVQAEISYQLNGNAITATNWKFTRSFPQLPTNSAAVNVLKSMVLYDTYVIVSTNGRAITEKTITLKPGINFRSQLLPTNIYGIVQSTIDTTKPALLFGTINIPADTAQFTPLLQYEWPWKRATVPGLNLQIATNALLQVTSKVKLTISTYRIYTPLTQAWFVKNPSYNPDSAFEATVDTTDAALKMNVTAFLPAQEIPQLSLFGEFKGFTLNKLQDLIELAGPSDLLSFMPDDIKNMANSLGKLELVNMGLTVSMAGGKFSIPRTFVTVGFPELNWSPIPGVFDIKGILAKITLISPFSKPDVTVRLSGLVALGGVMVNWYADSDDSFYVQANLVNQENIPLSRIIDKYAPGFPKVANISIDDLSVRVAPGKSYMMSALLASKPNEWILPLGPTNLTVNDVSILMYKANGQNVNGSFGGTVAIGTYAKFDILYEIPGDFILRGELPQIKLRQLMETLTNQLIEIPDAFDLTFKNNNVLVEKQATNYTFQLATQLQNFGVLAFQVQKVNTQWGFAFGMNMTTGKISSLPGLSFLSIFEKVFTLNKLMVVVSSFDGVAFRFPDMAKFQNPVLATTKVQLPASSGGMVAGLNVYAQWTINTGDKQQNLLRELLGLDPVMDITLQVSKVPSQNSKLYLSYSTTINGHPFVCMIGGQIVNNTLGLFLTGKITVSIQGTLQTFDVTLLFVTTGAFISATMRSQTAIDFGVFKLSNLAMAIGVNWGGIPSLGIAATIDVSKFQSSVAVFFDSTNPSKSMVAGALSDLTLADVLDTLSGNNIPSEIDSVLDTVAVKGTRYFNIAGSLGTDLDNLRLDRVAAACFTNGGLAIPSESSQVLLVVNTKGQIWYLTDMTTMRHYAFKRVGTVIKVSTEAQFYCAPQDTAIGSIVFPQAFYVNASLVFLGFSAAATIDIKPNKGILVDAQMDKLVIVNEKLFSIQAMEGDGGPKVSIATFSDSSAPDPKFRTPHFYVNGKLQLLGTKRAAYVNVNSTGANFVVDGDIVPRLVRGKLDGVFSGIKNLSAKGAVEVGVREIDLGLLGSLRIDTDAGCSINVSVALPSIFSSFTASFQLAGMSYNLGTVSFNVKTNGLEDLPEILFNAIKKFLIDLFKDIQKWLKMVGEGIIKGIESVTQVLKDYYKKTAAAAAAALKAAGYAIDVIGKELASIYSLGADAVSKALKAAGYTVIEVGKVMVDVFKLGSEELAKALKFAGYTADLAAKALQTYYKLVAEEAVKVLKTVGYAAEQTVLAIRHVYRLGAAVAAQLLKDVGYTATQVAKALKAAAYAIIDIGKALKNVFALASATVTKILKAAGYLAGEAAIILKNVYAFAADAAVKALKAVSYAVEAVGNALKDVYAMTAQAAATLLKGVGYAIDEIGNALKNVYGLASDAAITLLKGIGYAVDQIAGTLKNVYGLAADATAAALKAAGYAVDEVGSALKNAYGYSAEATLYVLRGIGYGVDQVAGTLRNVYGLGADATAVALRGAGYAVDEVGSALKNVYGLSSSAALAVLGGVGYGIEQITGTLRNVYGLSAGATATVLRGAGYAVEQTGNILKNVYGISSDAATGALNAAGYSIEEISKGLKSVFGMSESAISSALQGIGYSAGQVESAFKNLGGSFSDFASDAWGTITDPDTWNPSNW